VVLVLMLGAGQRRCREDDEEGEGGGTDRSHWASLAGAPRHGRDVAALQGAIKTLAVAAWG
jgi:hypothetical protein